MIKNIKILSNELNIFFDNEKEDKFPNIWLRDHARDDTSWDSRSHQRKVFTAKIDNNLERTENLDMQILKKHMYLQLVLF